MPFFITFLAGLATLLGYFLIYINNYSNRILISSLGFASGVMFYISLFDLIPESISVLSNHYNIAFSFIICLLFMTIGIITSSFLDKMFSNKNNHLYHVGIISMLGIIIHNIPEGIATYLTTTYSFKFGLILALSIALHNIPEGVSISIPIYYSTNSKIKAFIYTLISGMSELIGAVFAYIFIKEPSMLFMGALYSMISGIMIYISICELLPVSLGYKNCLLTWFSFILGIFFILISIILIN